MKAELIDHMGDDLFVSNIARVSMAKWREDFLFKGDERIPNGESGDDSLIRFLAKNNHWTPFGHPQISLRMSAPVPIRTQCFKHKQGFVENEESRRYISSEPELFVPEYFRLKPKWSIKQGSGDRHIDSDYIKDEYLLICNKAIQTYIWMINESVCPEQARFVLPQGCIVNWIWTGSLYAYANFYNKRTDSHAQKEIQDLAKRIDKIIRPLFPVSWAALVGDEK